MELLHLPRLRTVSLAEGSTIDTAIEFVLPRSKSESNRMLVLQAIAGEEHAHIEHLSEARDTHLLQAALRQTSGAINVLDAGTAMRFATAYHAVMGHEVILYGTPRMHARPIGPLVDALRALGAQIRYLENEGYPPLQLEGFHFSLEGHTLPIRADVSSQFITALMLVMPLLPLSINLELVGHQVSTSYINMTVETLRRFGLQAFHTGSLILVQNGPPLAGTYEVEADWSAAGYAFSLVGLTGQALFLPGLRQNSSQGDRRMLDFWHGLGVQSAFTPTGLLLKRGGELPSSLHIDFELYPDQAQTLAVYCAATGVRLELTGLGTLRIKETDRIAALQQELQKLGCDLEQTGEDAFVTTGAMRPPTEPLFSHDDHRMAMSLAPLSALFSIEMEGVEAVVKSFPGFWEQLEKLR